ncbi:DUF4870 domain-containing protein [Aestuariimicrobium kwangyangense]|uniref:DUF4870 domain-containing protein n=1 Tax=Aestuariimicrobium kwangyangense TaxID=396389 RepID=UPI0003B64C0F|nr:DUF4870 domain-containing protein [Aestuariimicrobium kwangyangense]
MSSHDSSPRTIRPEVRTAAALAHLSAIIAMVVSAGWLTFLGPLTMWVLYRDRNSYVRRAAAGSFNFNVWNWVIGIVGWICVLSVVLMPVGLVLWAVSAILTLWCHIHAALRAFSGRSYRYPFEMKLLS